MSETKTAAILSVMLGTAGHVDHGKTSLVRNLSDFDTDRHPEERTRGMSIDFAVAPFPLPDGRIAGIIDVPGHEDFIRNMVSGASSIDLLLLIIAADDAIMPQTEEHLRIAKALGMSGLIAVITKTDLVSTEVLEMVTQEVRAFLTEAGYGDAPIVPVSNTAQTGLQELRDCIVEALSKIRLNSDERAFRMPIRQVFSAKGHGLILTGVPLSGQLSIDDPVEILPLGRAASVRGIQNYRQNSGSTEPHRSSAINIRSDLAAEELHRGMVLAAPGAYGVSEQVIAWFRNDSPTETIRSRSTLLFHSGTLGALAKVRFIDCSELAPGGEAFIRLRFEKPVTLAAGDRFVLRSNSRHHTFGGGRILSAHVSRSRKLSESLFDRLIRAKDALDSGDLFLCELFAGSQLSFSAELLKTRSQLPAPAFQRRLEDLQAKGDLLPLGDGAYLVKTRADELRLGIKRALQRYHQIQKFAWGMKPSYVCDLLKLPLGSFPGLEKVFLEDSELQMKHGRLALQSFEPQINQREIRLRDDILRIVEKAGIQSVARGNILEQLKITEVEFRAVLRLLIDENLLVLLGSNLLFQPVLESSRKALLELFQTQKIVEIGQFREKTGASRNVAALILDSFDSEGLTKRVENGRILTRKK